MTKIVLLLTTTVLLTLTACSKAPDATNVADTGNSAGAALENSAAELEATTDNLVDGEVANIDAEANETAGQGGGTNAVTK